jgi:hypothetical protein
MFKIHSIESDVPDFIGGSISFEDIDFRSTSTPFNRDTEIFLVNDQSGIVVTILFANQVCMPS